MFWENFVNRDVFYQWDANFELFKLLGEKKNPAQKYDPPVNKVSPHNKISTSTNYATHNKNLRIVKRRVSQTYAPHI